LHTLLLEGFELIGLTRSADRTGSGVVSWRADRHFSVFISAAAYSFGLTKRFGSFTAVDQELKFAMEIPPLCNRWGWKGSTELFMALPEEDFQALNNLSNTRHKAEDTTP